MFEFDPRPLKTTLILCLNVYLFSSTYRCIAFFQPRSCSLLFLGLTLQSRRGQRNKPKYYLRKANILSSSAEYSSVTLYIEQ